MLALQYEIMKSDSKQPVVAEIVVGYDSYLNLVVLVTLTDNEKPENSGTISAVLKKNDAFSLAKLIGVSMPELPEEIARNAEEFTSIKNAGIADIMNCFNDITGRMEYEGFHYRIYRSNT